MASMSLDVLEGSGPLSVPHATLRLHCVHAGDLCEDADPRNIAVSHVRGNPLKAADLRDSLDMTQFRHALAGIT